MGRFRDWVRRWFPVSETSRGELDEDVESFGAEVEVLDAVGEDAPGRIRFQGTTWPAKSLEGTIQPGETAQLAFRDNLVWFVQRKKYT